MLEKHRSQIEEILQQTAAILSYSLNVVQLSSGTGYIEGDAVFVEGVRLVFFEFWQLSAGNLERKKYRFHCMDSGDQLVFRYDNAPHHQTIPTFPDHKHTPQGIMASSPPTVAAVIAEVELFVLGL